MVQKKITLSQAIEGYFIAAGARRLSPHTMADYDNTFRKFEDFLGDNPPLSDITPSHVRRFLGSLNGLSAKTALNYHVGLSALWTWAIAEDLAQEHIVRKVQAPKPEQREILPYTKRGIKAMLAACDHSTDYIQLVSRRHGRGSIILTSNKSYGDWGDIFADQVLAAAILDRLLHFSTTINIRGQSYRLREKRKAGVFTELTDLQKEAQTSPSNI